VHFSLDGEQILQLHNEKARRRHRSGTGYFFFSHSIVAREGKGEGGNAARQYLVAGAIIESKDIVIKRGSGISRKVG